MIRHVLVATAAAALIFAKLSPSAIAEPGRGGEHHQFSAEDRAAFTDARIAALKAGLKLTAAQEKNWPALESALRDAAKARETRASEWREKAKELHEKHDVVEGMRLVAKGLSSRSAELEKIANAAKPLVDSLDDAQRRRFGVLLHHIAGRHHHHFARWGMRHDGGSEKRDNGDGDDD